jgi:ribosomal protein S18 acetylase RimI-like enzyme
LLATFNPGDDNPYLNYAIPDESATPARGDVERLIERSHARDRRPRLEYLTLLAPAVEPVLLEAGFDVEGRLPLMLCTRDELAGSTTSEEIELVAPTTDEDFAGAALAQWEAYEGDGTAPARLAAGLRRTSTSGGVVVLARDRATGEPAGAGLVTAPSGGVAELTSIGVRSTFRRRGIAAAMTAWLAGVAFDAGMELVFLMAAGDAEARIYERAGFTTTSDVLHISSSL